MRQRTRYDDLILELGASEAWGDAALKDGFLEKAIDYYADAWKSARSLRDARFAAELEDTKAQAELDRVGRKWDAALKALTNDVTKRGVA